MSQDLHVTVHFKDFASSDAVREPLEKKCRHLATEFPETDRFEITLAADASEIRANAHATGKNVNSSAHATESDARKAGDRALDKLEKELRRHHDKKIFAQRRAAQKRPPKKS